MEFDPAALRSLEAKVEKCADSIGQTNEKVTRVEAMLEAMMQRASDEREVLFGGKSEHGRRIAEIERDYVPRREHEAIKKEHAERMKAIEGALSDLKGQMSKIAGGIAVLSVLVQVAMKLFWN